jgi:hypothetical protein
MNTNYFLYPFWFNRVLTTLYEHYNTDNKTQWYFDVQGTKSVLGVKRICEPQIIFQTPSLIKHSEYPAVIVWTPT